MTAGIVAWHGADLVAAALARAGPRLLWLAPYFLLWLVLAAMAWSAIFPRDTRPSFGRIVPATWIGFSINWLLPVGQVGGDIAKAVWLARRAKPAPLMVGTAVVDKTLQAAAQGFVALIGVALLLALADDSPLLPAALGFAAVILALFLVFYFTQRHGLFGRLASLAERAYARAAAARGSNGNADLGRLTGGAAHLDAAIRETCAAPWRLALYLFLRLLSRLLIAGEVWLTLYFMGHPIGIPEALMVECLGQTVRAAAFAVPGAYGVQETAYILLGALVGVPPDVALALSLAKRMREIVVGVPALIFWQVSEGRLALQPR